MRKQQRWQRSIRTYPWWVYEFVDRPRLWWYRLTYCRKYEHQTKMKSYDRCVNCGASVRT